MVYIVVLTYVVLTYASYRLALYKGLSKVMSLAYSGCLGPFALPVLLVMKKK
jgi:hypothetical protein